MDCNHALHGHTLDASQLYTEAASVGLLLVPTWWAVSKLTTALRVGGTWKPAFDVALSGFLFHMAAEETGMNEWYLFHSYAAQKAQFAKRSHAWAHHLNAPLYQKHALLYDMGDLRWSRRLGAHGDIYYAH